MTTAELSDTAAYITFSPRELTIIRELMRDGAANERIADRLYLAVDTVKSHIKSILRKSGRSTRTALVVALWRREVVMVDARGRIVEP